LPCNDCGYTALYTAKKMQKRETTTVEVVKKDPISRIKRLLHINAKSTITKKEVQVFARAEEVTEKAFQRFTQHSNQMILKPTGFIFIYCPKCGEPYLFSGPLT